MKRAEVELPVCPECLLVGRHPFAVDLNRTTYYCTGPKEDQHKKVKMKRRSFREVRERA